MTTHRTITDEIDDLTTHLMQLTPSTKSDSDYDDAIDLIRSLFLDPDEFPNDATYDEYATVLDTLASAYLARIRPDLFD